jgi:hypothetical protein
MPGGEGEKYWGVPRLLNKEWLLGFLTPLSDTAEIKVLLELK